MKEPEIIDGEIYEIIYQNEDNGYTVCEVSCNNSIVTACGHMPFVAPGEGIRMKGKWVMHPDYGEQFSVQTAELILPREASSILLFLSSGIVSGIREATAKKIVNRFGADTLKVIASEPEKLAGIKGISLSRAMQISDSFLMRWEAANTVIFLQNYGISAKTALIIHKRFGDTAIELIKNDPYILCANIRNIGFKTADRIASEMGIPKNHRGRIAAGIRFILIEAALNGHTCIGEDELIRSSTELLGVNKDELYDVCAEMKKNCALIEEAGFVYLTYLYNDEVYAAGKIGELLGKSFKFDNKKIAGKIKEFSKQNEIALTEKQAQAVRMALTNGVSIITGGPGTGKTTIMQIILELFKEKELSAALCAPTGKAAKRLSESCKTEAKTLHRLLGVEITDREEQRFSKNETNPMEYDVVILDEMSMVDISLFSALLRAMKKGSRLIMAGDVDQLPSVGAGDVLRDLIESGKVPAVRLTEVFRQAEESRIIINAHRINSGEMPLANDPSKDFFFMPRSPEGALEAICSLCESRLTAAYGFDPFNDIQVIAPSRKGVAGVINLNNVLQARLNPPAKNKKEKKFGERIFRVGDKVMQVKNNYDIIWRTSDGETEGAGIYNGDIGIIADIIQNDNIMIIRFDDNKIVEYDFASVDELEMAYALTVHKSQGCEFNAVVMPVCPMPPMLMTRNLLYTAVTRAKKLAVLIGSENCVAAMVRNGKVQIRYSGLKNRLEKVIE